MVKQICRTPTEQKQVNLNARNALRLGNNSTEPTEVFLPPKGIDRSLTAAERC